MSLLRPNPHFFWNGSVSLSHGLLFSLTAQTIREIICFCLQCLLASAEAVSGQCLVVLKTPFEGNFLPPDRFNFMTKEQLQMLYLALFGLHMNTETKKKALNIIILWCRESIDSIEWSWFGCGLWLLGWLFLCICVWFFLFPFLSLAWRFLVWSEWD